MLKSKILKFAKKRASLLKMLFETYDHISILLDVRFLIYKQKDILRRLGANIKTTSKTCKELEI